LEQIAIEKRSACAGRFNQCPEAEVYRKEANMLKSKPILLSVTILLIISAGCVPVPPGMSSPDPNFISTAVVQTVIAASTQTAQFILTNTGIQGSPTLGQTFTPEPPTLTPTETLTLTPAFTSTPLVPLISVSVATNCRLGPGTDYEKVGALLVGETAEVYGRDPTGNYWYIRNPNAPPEFCWLWGQYATLVGNTVILPVYTPPPTPTPAPDFKASYRRIDTCTRWWVEIRLDNNGGVTFSSMSLTVRDKVTSVVLSQNTDSFTNLNGCNDSVSGDVLKTGGSRLVSSPPFTYNPAGHDLRATITLCSGNGQTGTCITRVINFTA
jgi:hypothetical protein